MIHIRNPHPPGGESMSVLCGAPLGRGEYTVDFESREGSREFSEAGIKAAGYCPRCYAAFKAAATSR